VSGSISLYQYKTPNTYYDLNSDLHCAFLQIPLEKASRKWTAFQFEGQVYQFTRVPYGYRNALAGFIRELQVVLGADSGRHVLHYVDDIIIYSRTYDEHLRHLDSVFNKLTTAGFFINLKKCSFFKQEIKFLGHVLSKRGLKPDPHFVN
jgi:hypothetical protein